MEILTEGQRKYLKHLIWHENLSGQYALTQMGLSPGLWISLCKDADIKELMRDVLLRRHYYRSNDHSISLEEYIQGRRNGTLVTNWDKRTEYAKSRPRRSRYY